MARKQAVICDACGKSELYVESDHLSRDDYAPAGWFDLYRADEDAAWDVNDNHELCSVKCVRTYLAVLEAEERDAQEAAQP